ncbi:MAG: hypothetical protein M0D55_13955 [Elusimicrobiota bacterium]|nr:MAG: hypothetical protein M0D55_13955 [Elusimicrobiota bacterium]
MTPHSLARLGRRVLAAVLSAAVASSGTAPIYAQEIRVIRGGGEAARAGEAGALSLPNVLAPLSPSSLNASLTPSLALPSAAPSAAAYAPAALGGHARMLRAAPVPTLSPAPAVAAAPAPVAAGPFAALKALVASPVPSAAERPAAPAAARTPAATEVPEALSASASPAASREHADAQFRRLTGEAAARGAAAAPEPVVAEGFKKSWKRRLGLTAATVVGGGALAVANTGTKAAGVIPAASASDAVSAPALGEFLGQAGYYAGNVLAFLFPMAEMLRSVQQGKVTAPKWRVGVLVAASLALGVVSAPVGGLWFWGIQNIFGAAVIMASWPAARWGKKAAEKSEGGVLPARKAWGIAGAAVVVSLAAAAALYFAAAAAVPAALTAALGAAGVAGLLLGIQFVTGGAYLLLFAPDVWAIMRGQAPKGFTPGFSMMFLLASLAFVVWAGQLAWVAAPGSSQQAQFIVYTVLNAVYVLVSGASWWITRKPAKSETVAPAPAETAPEPEAVVPPPARAPPASRFASLAEAESRAHSSARKRAGNVRLLRVGVDLKSAGPRWVFAFHAPAKGQILTYGPKGVEARKTTAAERPAMLHPEQLAGVALEARVAALKEREPGFDAVRAEIVATKDGYKVYGYDKKGASREMPLPEAPAEPAAVAEAPSQADSDMVQEYGPVHDEFPGLPAGMVKVGSEAPAKIEAPVPPAVSAEPKLPRSWRRFPAEARDMDSAALLAAKADAQARARAGARRAARLGGDQPRGPALALDFRLPLRQAQRRADGLDQADQGPLARTPPDEVPDALGHAPRRDGGPRPGVRRAQEAQPALPPRARRGRSGVDRPGLLPLRRRLRPHGRRARPAP